MAGQDILYLLSCPLLHRHRAPPLPLRVGTLVRQIGVEGFLVVPQGVLVAQIVSRGPQFVNDVQRERLLIHRDASRGGPYPADGVVSDCDQGERALHARVHKADVMDDVSPVQ